MSKLTDKLKKWSGISEISNLIQSDLYDKYNINTDLRDTNTRRAATGLTRVGEIAYYSMEKGELIPESGRLKYRGYEVSEIIGAYSATRKFGYEEVCYLLIFGDLPTSVQLDDFVDFINEYRELPNGLMDNVVMYGPNVNLMNTIERVILTMYCYDSDAEDQDAENVLRQCVQLIARIPVIAIESFHDYLTKNGIKSWGMRSPQMTMCLAEYLLYMIKGPEKYTIKEIELFDIALMLLAEHGAGSNASFTTHVVTSAVTDTYSVFAAAFSSLKGLKHAGSIIKINEMMAVLKRQVKEHSSKVEIEKNLEIMISEDLFDEVGSLYGFGHSVYTKVDPRVVIIKEFIKEAAAEKGFSDAYNLYTIVAMVGEELLLKNNKESIVVTIEFYMSLLYEILEVPPEMFSPIYAIARSAGIGTHCLEELLNDRGIVRPLYKSVNKPRKYIDIVNR